MIIKDFIIRRIKASKLTRAKKTKLISSVPDIKLSDTQAWGVKTYHSSKQKILLGEKIKLIYSELGVENKSDAPQYQGMIVSFMRPVDTMPRLRIEWEDNKITSVWLYQIDFKKENIQLSRKEREAIIKARLLTKMTEEKNSNKERLKIDLATFKHTLTDYLRATKMTQEKIATAEKIIKAMKNNAVTPDQLEEEFKMVRKLDTIEEVYLSAKGNIIALTKDLFAVKANKINKKVKLGRFVIVLNYANPSMDHLLINNRDWLYDSNIGHPHLNGTGTCWGSAADDVRIMYRNCRVFQLIDLIITFYSTYPQTDSSPYIPYGRWLRGRKKVKNDVLVGDKI